MGRRLRGEARRLGLNERYLRTGEKPASPVGGNGHYAGKDRKPIRYVTLFWEYAL